MKNEITPALNAKIHQVANAECTAKNDFSKKAFIKAFNAAIIAEGYTVAYYNKVMRNLFNSNY